MNAPTKKQLKVFLYQLFPETLFSYSGKNKTIYLTGPQAKDAELALYKTYGSTMLFKTESSLTRLVQQAKSYHFTADGTAHPVATVNGIIFSTKARTLRNAKRKFGNHITSLTKLK